MDQKDRNNIKGMVKKCLVNADLISIGKVVVPIFKYSLTDQLIEFFHKKKESICDIYEQSDIYQMIMLKTGKLFGYHEYSQKLKGMLEFKDDQVINHGRLKDFLKEHEIIELTDFILKEFEEPDYSYALVYLPNVELSCNIKINEDLFLVGDLEVERREGYFRIHEKQKGEFRFCLENEGSYLMIRQLGRTWRFPGFSDQEPLVYKNIMLKLKTFLGLALIRGIFATNSIIGNQEKPKSNLQIGIFTKVEWSEGVEIPSDIQDEIGVGELVPEGYPEFEDLRLNYSGRDALRYFSFQKRFFLEDEIEIAQTLGKILHSFFIAEKNSKQTIDREKGKIVPLPLPHVQRAKSLEQHLGVEFDRLRILLDSIDDDAERIKAAVLWYLEGFRADNDTFKFINYTIAIEALLGDEDKDNGSLTEALSSRCGFWLGTSLQEKQDIRKRFRDIYKTRSRIVHGGTTIINKEDRESLKSLEEWTKQLITDAEDFYYFKKVRTQEEERP